MAVVENAIYVGYGRFEIQDLWDFYEHTWGMIKHQRPIKSIHALNNETHQIMVLEQLAENILFRWLSSRKT